MTKSPYHRAHIALRDRFHKLNPDAILNDRGRVDAVERNLLPDVRLTDFEADLREGDGNELAGKFLSVHSSSALTVNTFAPFKRDPGKLCLFGHAGLKVEGFERKCSAGVTGRGSPNLDVIASKGNEIVARPQPPPASA